VSDLTAPTARRVGLILKIAIFATGIAGIVAEFVLSTLATYLIGNAVFQWTMVMSLMLFAMGLGSRLSKNISDRLLDKFILIEFALSLFCASSSALAYGLSAFTGNIELVIYSLAVIIGALIGFEIPLVTRLNESYEELRSNIAGVMEKDYYGALIGGLFFGFFALPYLGLTYTPVALGAINFLVASILLWSFFGLTQLRKTLTAAFAVAAVFLVGLTFVAEPVVMFGEQRQYRDKVILARQTAYQNIVMTRYKEYYWLYINGQEQFSTFDEEKYHEPLVHPAMKLTADPRRVLILGGGDGLALREIWKHQGVESAVMVDLDKAMTDLAANHPILLEINDGSMLDPRLEIVNMDAAAFLKQDDRLFGAIIIDLPDPDSVDLMHLYSESFYRLAARHLQPGGMLVTQAASPYFARQAFLCIAKTMEEAGFGILPYHNQVPTMGEWGWVMGTQAEREAPENMKRRLLAADFESIPTRFLDRDAAVMMVHFGKGIFESGWRESVEKNTQAEPVLFRYYREGSWSIY
jgi:spermidine synthase